MEHEEAVKFVAKWFRSQKDVTLVKRGSGDFPDPDVLAQYESLKTAYVECKPSDADRREYLTGLGQAVAYTVLSNFSYLAIPDKEMKEFSKFFVVARIGMLSLLETGEIHVLRKAPESRPARVETRERSYGYYRDLKPHEILEVLRAVYGEEKKDRIRDTIWKTLNKMRDLRSKKQKTGWIINTQLLLRDLGLIDISWRLTKEGLSLLQLGHDDVRAFQNELTKCFLLRANYLDILGLIQELNDRRGGFVSVAKFKEELAKAMIKDKLATPQTNVLRDLQDILRILKELGLIGEWEKFGLGGRFSVRWKRVTPFLR